MPGMKVRLTGDLQQIPLPSNPGQFNERSYYYARKVKWYLEGRSLEAVGGDARSFDALRCEAKAFLKEKILQLAPGRTGGIFCAMMLGEKQEIGRENQMLLRLDGVLHIAAISGTHLSFLGWGLYRILRKLRLPVPGAGGISVFLMIQYGIFTGSSASAMRAVIMFSLAVGAMAVGRTYDLLSALSLSAVLLLWKVPVICMTVDFCCHLEQFWVWLWSIRLLWKRKKKAGWFWDLNQVLPCSLPPFLYRCIFL